MWAHCNSTLFLLICLATGAAVKQIQSNPFPLTLVITMHIICLPFQIFTYIGLVFPVILKSDLKCSLLSIRASLLNKYPFFLRIANLIRHYNIDCHSHLVSVKLLNCSSSPCNNFHGNKNKVNVLSSLFF